LLTTASHQECLVARDSSSDPSRYFFFSIRTPAISDHHPQSNNVSRDILIHSYFLDGIKRISRRLSRDLNLMHPSVNNAHGVSICNANSRLDRLNVIALPSFINASATYGRRSIRLAQIDVSRHGRVSGSFILNPVQKM
jgi:hypothetical protein